ncbi:MAG: RNA polymerase sigma factor [Actinomycetota bacterium]
MDLNGRWNHPEGPWLLGVDGEESIRGGLRAVLPGALAQARRCAGLVLARRPRDVAQEAFARAFERWNVVRSHPNPDGWLFLTAYRVAGRVRRRHRLSERHRSADVASRPENPGAAAEAHEALAVLSPRQRAAVILRHHYGLSTSETARALRCREGTVKSLVARAKEALIETAFPEER